MAPSEERYAAEIEKTLYNAILRQLGMLRNVPDPMSIAKHTYTGHQFRSMVNMQGTVEKLSLPHANCCEGQGTRALGSLPEYVYTLNASAPEEGLWLNLFVPSTLRVNVTVVEGVAPNPPRSPVPVPPPPAPLPPVPPAPPLTWELVATDAIHPSGAGMAAGVWSVNVSSEEECQRMCVASSHPNACMGVSWHYTHGRTPSNAPAPHDPATCQTGCTMVPTGDTWYPGAFSNAVNLSAADCATLCLKDARCVQTTVGPGADRCVTYSAIRTLAKSIAPGVLGFLKCGKPGWTTKQGRIEMGSAAGGGHDAVCTPHITPSPDAVGSCQLFRNIDMSQAVQPARGTTQWLLHGRRNAVEIDYVPQPPSHPLPSTPTPRNGTVTADVVINTSFPFDSKVSLTLGWADERVRLVRYRVSIRVPSWIQAPTVVVAVNGQPYAGSTPGSYLSLDRLWENGDVVSFDLPMGPSNAELVQYPLSGIDNIKGYEGSRYALKLGPIVLLCSGPLNSDQAIVLPVDPTADPSSWLVPVPGSPLHFGVKGVEGSKATFKPTWSVAPDEPFTTFPVFAGAAGSLSWSSIHP